MMYWTIEIMRAILTVLVHRNHASQSGRFQGSGISGWESESDGSDAFGSGGTRRSANDSRQCIESDTRVGWSHEKLLGPGTSRRRASAWWPEGVAGQRGSELRDWAWFRVDRGWESAERRTEIAWTRLG